MVTIRKMEKRDVPQLYGMALRAFQPDHERYGVYPPLLNTKRECFLPPLLFGKVLLAEGRAVGGAFVTGMGASGEIGAIFIDPAYRGKGYGRQAMLAMEQLYPKVKIWRLETPGQSLGLHRFYESLGYVKAGERRDNKSGMVGFVYEKRM